MNPLEHPANVGKDVGEPSFCISIKCNALPKNSCSCCPKEINQCPGMFSICFKPNYMFCSCRELFISVGFQQAMGLASLVPIFADNASLYSSCML